MGDGRVYNYDTTNHNPSPSATSSPSPQPHDEISLFLRQILFPSSSSSPSLLNAHTSMSLPMANAHFSARSSLFQDAISALDSSASPDLLLSSSPTYMNPSSAVNVSSSSFGVSENEIDEYDCESEEGIEALVEEQPAKPVPPRSSSKRSRAAEVHNLSEKRRRSRINEKMKALQNLIPNSNKTDKASMLDEAIEYLKQLQLQVQMLSMRNGLSLHPMCFSEGMQAQAALQLSQMRSEMDEENRSLPINMSTPTLPLPQENPLQYVSNSTLPNQRNARNQALVPSPSIIITPETSFGLEYPMLPHLRPFQLNRTCEIRGDDILQHQQLNANHSDTNPLGGSQEGQELFGNMHCRKRSVGSYPKK